MQTTQDHYQGYLAVLKEEMLSATGCTEPISIAYAAAKAREVLGVLPKKVQVSASSNIIKNVKSVVVPGTGGEKGIQAAVAAGLIAGKAEQLLDVIRDVSKAEQDSISNYLKKGCISVHNLQTDQVFDLLIHLWSEEDEVRLRITYHHTNIVWIEKNKKCLYEAPPENTAFQSLTDRSFMSVQGIIHFADTVDLNDINDLIECQIEQNMAIAKEGMRGEYGAQIGKIWCSANGDGTLPMAVAMAAAGSDARMSGCEMPVVILSGSGNQGMATSVPVIVYAERYHKSKEELVRALVLANLLTIHQKNGIGRLSAYCGAVSAGCAAGAGIAYLLGGGYDEVAHTLVNSLSVVSGIICDGAKASCAAKIAMSVQAGLMGYTMYQHHQQFYSGEGLVCKDVESTLQNIGRLGSRGMRETDKEIIHMMLKDMYKGDLAQE